MKRPDYEELSLQAEKECENDVALAAARKEIYDSLTESVQILKSLRNSSDANISLKAAKEHLLLAGLYVQKHDHRGSVNFVPLKLSQEDFGDE